MGEHKEKFRPQLVMERNNLANLPTFTLPSGYKSRHFTSGDEEHWERIIEESFQSKRIFEQTIMCKPYFQPERVWFLCFEDSPIATATAWEVRDCVTDIGYLHMVGVLPEHTGKGLGYWVSVLALQHMALTGKDKVILQTDDFRIPAIKTYLKLGFTPVIIHENQVSRWKTILQSINRTELIKGLEYELLSDNWNY